MNTSHPPECVAGTVDIAGPAGRLEALVACPDGPPAAVAVVCHPHSLYGGSLQNKVVHTLARVFVERGCMAVRFNFRGVGRSEGAFDHGAGESDDLAAVVSWARTQTRDLPLWLAGFSFGGAVALRAAAQLRASGLVTVAPAVTRVLPTGAVDPGCPWLLVQGEDDEVVPAPEVRAWLATLVRPPRQAWFEGGGHFFHGQLGPLRERLHHELDALVAR